MSTQKQKERNIIILMVGLNILSLLFYAVEWDKTGTVITSSGARAEGYHEIPAMVAFLAYLHQVFVNQKNGWHPLVGKIATWSSVICLVMATRNIKSGILGELRWMRALPQTTALRQSMLVWNEAVNIHQFLLYGPVMTFQLWKGYRLATTDIKQHEIEMRSVTMFLLGPLSQRFLFNHLTDRRDEIAFMCQAVTYSLLMVLLDFSAASKPLRVSLVLALAAALLFVSNDSSVLHYLLAIL